MARRTDKERLDWLDAQEGGGLLSDDAGRWAYSGDGSQNVIPRRGKGHDFSGEFFVEAKDWRKSVRGAIDAEMRRQSKLGVRKERE